MTVRLPQKKKDAIEARWVGGASRIERKSGELEACKWLKMMMDGSESKNAGMIADYAKIR